MWENQVYRLNPKGKIFPVILFKIRMEAEKNIANGTISGVNVLNITKHSFIAGH